MPTMLSNVIQLFSSSAFLVAEVLDALLPVQTSHQLSETRESMCREILTKRIAAAVLGADDQVA